VAYVQRVLTFAYPPYRKGMATTVYIIFSATDWEVTPLNTKGVSTLS